MRRPPLSVIVTWPAPNYEDPETRGPALLVVESIFLALAWIFLSLRLYVRVFILRKPWWDDWLMVLGALFSSGVTACVILATTRYGWNLHVWDIRLAQLIAGRQISIAGQTIFLFASNLSKLSILISYLRIASPKTKFRFFTWCTIAYVVLIHWIFLIVLWTQCIPSYYYWDLLDNGAHCVNEGPPLMGQITTNIAADVFVYVLPMMTLVKLKLPWSQRIALMVVFGFGAVVVVAACLRLYYTYQTVYATYDVTWEGYYLWIWTAVESNLGIICGCVPALKPLVYRAKGRLTNFSNKDSNSSKSRSYMNLGSNRKSARPGIEMRGAAKGAEQTRSNIEKTVEWEVTDYRSSSATVVNDERTTKGQDSWLDDADGHDIGRGIPYRSTAEITSDSFGLQR